MSKEARGMSITTIVGGLGLLGGAGRTALALLQWEPKHRDQFLGSLGFSFVVSAVVIRVFRRLTSSYQPKTYEEKPEKRALWNATGLSLMWPSWSVPLAVWAPLRTAIVGGISANMSADEGVRIGCGLSLGYMLYDFLDLAWWNKADTIKAQGMALWKQMFLHHLFSLLFWPYGLAMSKMVFPVTYFLFTELTNIGLNARWFCNEVDHKLHTPVFLVWYIAFMIVRILPAPWLLYQLALGDYSQWDYYDKCLGLFTLIPFGLNFFWFKLMTMGALKKLRGGSGKTPPKTEGHQDSSK